MDDIVERLRAKQWPYFPLMEEAATEIIRLRKLIEVLGENKRKQWQELLKK